MNKFSFELNLDLRNVASEFPDLELAFVTGSNFKLQGPLEIFDGDGKRRGVFEVQILFDAARYPHYFPLLNEISGIIPKITDRHIYTVNGYCCVTILQKQILNARRGISIYRFIKSYAIPYLANQIHFEKYGKWANGEYYHGELGQVQFYFEELKTKNVDVVIRGIEMILSGKRLDKKHECFCGSQKRFKACHKQIIEEIELLGKQQLQSDLLKIVTFKIFLNEAA